MDNDPTKIAAQIMNNQTKNLFAAPAVAAKQVMTPPANGVPPPTKANLQTMLASQSAPTPQASATPDIFTQAKSKYPILNNPNISYKYSPNPGAQNYLEAFPPGESGDPSQPRPKEFPMDKYGIQVYKPDTKPIDVLGDVVSHFLVKTDPVVKSYYEDFQKSLTPQQTARLQEQYQYAQKNEGEKRSFGEWYQTSGLPAYFRGYAFQQWPDAQKYYTPQQLKKFDGMMQYLSTAKPQTK